MTTTLAATRAACWGREWLVGAPASDEVHRQTAHFTAWGGSEAQRRLIQSSDCTASLGRNRGTPTGTMEDPNQLKLFVDRMSQPSRTCLLFCK